MVVKNIQIYGVYISRKKMKVDLFTTPCTPIKSKIGAKILSKNYVKTSFYRYSSVH